MKTLFVASLLLLFALPCQAEPLLRPNVVIDGDVVKLGDIFDGLPAAKADLAIARAPMPGKRVIVDASWLVRVANSYQLAWRPQNAYEQVAIERNGIVIPQEQIESRVLDALNGLGVPASAEIDWANRGIQVVVPVGAALRVGIRDVNYDERYGRFTATVEVPEGSPSATRLHVAGRVFKTVEVPVLAHSVNRGDVITAAALSWSKIREVALRRDMLTDPQAIIGMAAHQPLRSGQVVSSNDIERQVAVAKGALVTMILKLGSMSLTAQARALEQGSVGDRIRVTNTNSNMTVEGKIEGLNLVSVTPAGDVALSN
ncbi:MAG TPA: flagellar basal body P-ring formation protein FlgA [Rhodospirillaceae bacterium]|nr:flagellar basal body P-ring formation protein FlgA [Rhodospirillaceae bacterium]